MIIPIETFKEYSPSRIALPDWTHLNVTTKETIKLSWDSIYIDDISNNRTKVEPHTAEEIESLRLSFAEGVDPSQFPPAVIYRGKQFAKPYQLVYGFGRSEALRLLKTGEWFFTLLEGDEDGIEDVQASENEGLPKRLNQEADMRKFLIDKVVSGKIEKTESSIRKKFRLVYPNRRKEVENRVIPQVMKELGVPQPYILYTSSAKVQDWMDNHSQENYCRDGDFDEERDMFGMIMKEGYQYRAVLRAISKYADTGKKSYVMFHCGAPTKKAPLSVKRRKVLEQFDDIRKSMEVCGLKTWPIVVMGALPQDREKENIKQLVRQ